MTQTPHKRRKKTFGQDYVRNEKSWFQTGYSSLVFCWCPFAQIEIIKVLPTAENGFYCSKRVVENLRYYCWFYLSPSLNISQNATCLWPCSLDRRPDTAINGQLMVLFLAGKERRKKTNNTAWFIFLYYLLQVCCLRFVTMASVVYWQWNMFMIVILYDYSSIKARHSSIPPKIQQATT